jgi:hypothetical protein
MTDPNYCYICIAAIILGLELQKFGSLLQFFILGLELQKFGSCPVHFMLSSILYRIGQN